VLVLVLVRQNTAVIAYLDIPGDQKTLANDFVNR
jgi:hypothetical protein